MLRRLPLTYALYNLFQRPALEHNLPYYRAAGLAKPYWAPVSSKDFTGARIIRRDTPDLTALEALPAFKTLHTATQRSLQHFNETGYAILHGALPHGLVGEINAEIARLQTDGTIGFQGGGSKLMFAIHHSERLREIVHNFEFLPFLDVLIDGRARLFQSINFLRGSQQRTHSDSIHMTTHPLGGLLGVWIALEDISLGNGPLHYYPGSHQLPYVLRPDFDHGGNAFLNGPTANQAYENKIGEVVGENDFPKQVFLAKRGDVLIWHANLLHGGEPHTDADQTRKSMVLHYFDESRACYHEITRRPALFR